MAASATNRLGALLAAVFAVSCIASAAEPGKPTPMRVIGEYDASVVRDELAVARGVLELFEERVGPVPPGGIHPIALRQAPDDTPRCCLDGLPNEYRINVTCLGRRLYSQLTYQFSHELGHVWISPRSGNWFIESVCCAMSHVALEHMGGKWAKEPPFPNWRSYAQSFVSYNANAKRDALDKIGLASEDDIPGWVRRELPALARRNAVERKYQLANALLVEDILSRHPKAWGAITKLGAAGDPQKTDFGKWLALVTPGQRPLVAELAGHFDTTRETPWQLKTVRDFGAVGDGKADDSNAFQKAVDASTGDIFVPSGVYRFTKGVLIDLDKVGPASISGTGAARIVMAGPGPALKFVGTHGGTAGPATVKPNVWERQRTPMVDGIEIVGAHEKAVGIEAAGTMQMTITRVTVRKALHAVHLTTRNRNVIVSNCHFYENSGVGLYLDDVNLHQINVTGSHISYNGGGGIVLRAGNMRNLHVSGCDIEGNMAAKGPATANILIDGTGGAAGTAEVAITGCTLQHTHAAPDSANIRFIGTDKPGRRWGHITIGSNVLSDVQMNIDIRKARGVCITGNTFWKGVQHNLRIEDSSNIVIGANAMDRNPQYQDQLSANDGVLLRNCSDATITGLHINGVKRADAGMIVENCRRMNISNCTILDCDNAGLLLKNVSDSRVSGCLIRDDREDARAWQPLKTTGGKNNQITNNLFTTRPAPKP